MNGDHTDRAMSAVCLLSETHYNKSESEDDGMGLLRQVFGPSKEEIWSQLSRLGSAYETDPGVTVQ